jgi:hypothetical protein
MRIVVAWRREYSKSVWEGGVRHNLAHAKGLVVVLAKPIVAVNSSCCCYYCSSAAAELAAVAALVDVDVVVAAAVVVVVVVVAVAAPAVDAPAVAAAAGVQELADFVVDHHRMRWMWGMEEEYSYRKAVEEVLHSRQMENLYFDLGNSWMVNTEAAPYNSAAVVQME